MDAHVISYETFAAKCGDFVCQKEISKMDRFLGRTVQTNRELRMKQLPSSMMREINRSSMNKLVLNFKKEHSIVNFYASL